MIGSNALVLGRDIFHFPDKNGEIWDGESFRPIKGYHEKKVEWCWKIKTETGHTLTLSLGSKVYVKENKPIPVEDAESLLFVRRKYSIPLKEELHFDEECNSARDLVMRSKLMAATFVSNMYAFGYVVAPLGYRYMFYAPKNCAKLFHIGLTVNGILSKLNGGSVLILDTMLFERLIGNKKYPTRVKKYVPVEIVSKSRMDEPTIVYWPIDEEKVVVNGFLLGG